MATMTISQVSKKFCISTRMLRYYEKAGLLESSRREDYAYRIYDTTTLVKLQQILILRKLRISVKEIKQILQKPAAVTAIEVFQKNIQDLDVEITALLTIKDVLHHFVCELQKATNITVHNLITRDDDILSVIDSLSSTSIYFKEDRSMNKLNNAEKELSKLQDVRILYLPAATVAAAHYIGDDPEHHCNLMIDHFVRDSHLENIHPHLRHYGFNHPNPIDETDYHGYEMWVTIPADMEVLPPLTKKQFPGGLYAAHMIPMGNFNEWEWLFDWVEKSDTYAFNGDMSDQTHMCGLMDEHLNYISHIHLLDTEPEDLQLDLLMPIRERAK